jgi:hypothetical protein
MTPFEAYKTYLSLKMHFEKDGYSFFKYNGKVNVKIESFYARRDRYFFEKLARRKDLVDFLVANFLEKDHAWSRDLTHEEANRTYDDWCKRVESLTYRFKEEIDKIEDLKPVLAVNDGQHPELLKMYLQKKVSPETILILDDFTNMISSWDSKIQDKVVWPVISKKLKKYKPFLKFDKAKFKGILVEKYMPTK